MTELATLLVQVDTTKAEQELKDFGNQAERTGNQAEKTALKTKGIGQSAKSNVAPMRNMNYMARNVSYQLQDVAVQASMGTDSLRILSQQGPQLLSVFGTSGAIAGVVVGVGAAVAGMLAPALMSGKDSAEQMSAAMEDLDDILKFSATSVTGLSTEMEDLIKNNEALARIKLASALVEVAATTKMARDSIGDISEALIDATRNAEAYGAGITQSSSQETIAAFARMAGQIDTVAKSLGLTTDEAKILAKNIEDLDYKGVDSIQNLIEHIDTLGRAGGYTNDEFNEFASGIGNTLAQQLLMLDATDTLTRALEGEEIGVNKLVTALQEEYEQLVFNRGELLLLQLARREITQDTYDQANATLTLITAEEASREQAKVAAKEKEDQLKTLTRLESETDKMVETAQKRQDSFNEKQERSETRAAEASARIVEQYQARLNAITLTNDELNEYRINQLAVSDIDRQSIVGIQAKIDKELELVETKRQTNQSLIAFSNDLLANESKNTQAASRMAINLMDVEKRASAKKIITDSYGAAMSSYKALSVIPIIGPALGAASAAAIIAAGVTWASKSLAGRALGGQVRQGESYVVGERGPEVLTMGGSRGFVTPNDKLKSKTVNNQGNVANVTFNINANDTQGFDDLLNKRRGQIVSIINQALNNNGRSALT